ncbi:CaiB/BaiF CoA transferase family protein [Sulfitobacter geojensis]|uniref:CaiB/BaiF CoA transferase family protein n=1 Tax=Sulfitobacter geojensis TaxID=1342299 RepID=UPI000469E8FA|nr:CaiB/BaiF CoA-transferase family protein [Sulfitobacter geojensis]KHA54062.1 L-carnitine dehydratase/bile acid-inducible protein F [Sulfitobacter geojensis]NYI29880.1 crotonobetainyl-CoA:carnitine CoA-transferase CaiB-like acyl-CoA transferase [Sulfitobacter geojensis]
MLNGLEGLLVVSVEQAVAAPYVSGRLADAGARVIKVERPEGDFAREYDHLVKGESAYFVWLNRGKESVCLDLRAPADREVFEGMLKVADVFIQNLAPGAIDRLGYAPDMLRDQNPRLITLSISGYGDEGPYSKHKAYDLLVQAECGLSAITGNHAGPARVGVSVCDIACGMTAYQAVLEALLARAKTGKGRHISASLFHSLADWMNVPYLQYVYGGKEPVCNGLEHPTIAPYGAFPGSDGKLVLLSIQNEREWVGFCEMVLERPELATDPRFSSNTKRVENRTALDEIVCHKFSTQTRDVLSDLLHRAGIANGRVSTIRDLAEHPQNRLVEIDTPAGPIEMLSPGALADGDAPAFRPVPALGSNTEAVRKEFRSKKRVA